MRLNHNRLYVKLLKMLISVNRGAEEPLPRPDGYATRNGWGALRALVGVRCAQKSGKIFIENQRKSEKTRGKPEENEATE